MKTKCEFCTKVVHERKDEFEEPNCIMIRRWYKHEYVYDELNRDRRDEFYLFERRLEPMDVQKTPIWYLAASGKLLFPVNNCPKCGRDLV